MYREREQYSSTVKPLCRVAPWDAMHGGGCIVSAVFSCTWYIHEVRGFHLREQYVPHTHVDTLYDFTITTTIRCTCRLEIMWTLCTIVLCGVRWVDTVQLGHCTMGSGGSTLYSCAIITLCIVQRLIIGHFIRLHNHHSMYTAKSH